MRDREMFTPLHPTARDYIARAPREPLPLRLRELVEKLHETEPVRNPRETKGDAGPRESKSRTH